MADIIKEILKILPSEKISISCYEGANIVLYTKDKKYFLDNQGTIRGAVDEFKKRIELRPDPSICLKQEKAKKIIEELIPADAGLSQIIFDPQRSSLIIEVEKPGLAIGKSGQILRDIKEQTLWVPVIRRTSAIKSELIENIRSVLYENNDFRRKFLDSIGHRIYDGWTRGKKEEWVRVTMLGAGRQVGRSCILLQTPESRVLLDCGMDVAAGSESAYPMLESPDLRIDELDAVIISHAHMDHTGVLPLLYKYGYKGPVYCTTPTRDVMALLQLDFIKIQKAEGKEPIYSSDEVKEMVKHCITLEYEEVSDITPDIRITLYNAGHILGSAQTHIHIGNGLHNFVYTGDLKFSKSHLLDAADFKFPRVETMMIEATYGAQDSKALPEDASEMQFIDIITTTVNRGGKVLVPVLGTGRAQEVMLIVDKIIKEKKIEPINVYVDGMVWDITAIYTAYPEFMNADLKKQIFHKDSNPFLSESFKRVGSHKERVAIIDQKEPCVILATSGMLNGGPSVQYLKGLGEHEKNAIVFTCYQGENTLGRRILNGEKEIGFEIGNERTETIKIKLDVHRIDGLAGHATRQELIDYIGKCTPRPRKLIIQHGDTRACLDMASALHKKYKIETVAPRNLESIRLR